MNKVFRIVKVNYKINIRINSDKNPLIYYWLKNIGINMPPEVLAYLILISSFNTIFLGLIAEQRNLIFFGSLSPLYSSLVLILSIILVEILIINKRIVINNRLIGVLPLTNSEYLYIKLINHFFSLRIWNLISFFILYIIFSKSYNYSIFNHLFFKNCIFFFDIFLIFSSIPFYFNDKINYFFEGFNKMTLRVMRLFFVLIVFILIKKLSIDFDFFTVANSTFKVISKNTLSITIISVISLTITFVLCYFKKI